MHLYSKHSVIVSEIRCLNPARSASIWECRLAIWGFSSDFIYVTIKINLLDAWCSHSVKVDGQCFPLYYILLHYNHFLCVCVCVGDSWCVPVPPVCEGWTWSGGEDSLHVGGWEGQWWCHPHHAGPHPSHWHQHGRQVRRHRWAPEKHEELSWGSSKLLWPTTPLISLCGLLLVWVRADDVTGDFPRGAIETVRLSEGGKWYCQQNQCELVE